jgi:hypothetical protein
MTRFTHPQIEGARSLIRDGLKLVAHDSLVLISQRDLADAAKCIQTTAEDLQVNVDLREFSREDFFGEYPDQFRPDRLVNSVIGPSAVAILIEWSEETVKARLTLLRDLLLHAQGWRVAAMPGIDLSSLASCQTDLIAIKANCSFVFDALARARMAMLETKNPDNSTDTLYVPLGKYTPIISTGEISKGSWGNFPSGETFVVPDEYQAKGWVTVRGSIPCYPLESEEWIRCELRSGRIRCESITSSSSELKKRFRSLFFRSSGKVRGENTNALAELGIGTNPGIIQLTGKPILDEKKLGTIHIAFGSNNQFRGPLVSSVHHDIACTNATLKLNTSDQVPYVFGKESIIVRDGVFAMDRAKGVAGSQSIAPISGLPAAPRLRVFLCHSSEDKPTVLELWHRLCADNIEPWFDKKSLLPGQNWESEIKRAVRTSDAVIVCLSRGSVSKKGFVQKEIRFALDIADEHPEDSIFIIPARLEDCAVPDRLRVWQWVNLYEEDGYQSLTRALEVCASKRQRILV